jgi:TRAP-type C4-dicarboxylate transport system permease large subunit
MVKDDFNWSSVALRFLMATLLVGGIIWVLIYWNVFTPKGTRAISHIILIILALVLAVGMSWSHLTRRLSGQVDTDQIA